MITDKLAKIIIPFVVTTCFFYIEAVIHYNIGKKGYIAFKLPPMKKNMLIISIILFFSIISSCISHLIYKLVKFYIKLK